MSILNIELPKGEVFSIRNSQGLLVQVHHYSSLFQLLECSYRQLRTESELETGCKNDPKSTMWNSIKKCVKCYPCRAEICAEKQQEDEVQPRSSTETLSHPLSCSGNHRILECLGLQRTNKDWAHEPQTKQDSAAAWCCCPKNTRQSRERWRAGLIYMPAKPIFYLINIDLVGLLLILVAALPKKKKKKVGSNKTSNLKSLRSERQVKKFDFF